MDLAGLLQSIFGFPAFRANQEAVCRAATDGRDVLLVMPTGAGKSLCYQLPALARGGTALVVSPLIALMDDQAAKLTALGLRVGRIHSGLGREVSREVCRDYLAGTLQFLFIAPERMRVPGFPEMLARRKPALIAIDEAHCISAWGHDFRPDYRMLGDTLPALRPAPIIALTATATPDVQRDIITQLQLADPALFIHGFRRENLAIEVVELSKPQRARFTADFLAEAERRPAIVYAPSRRAAEELASELGRSFPAAAYHAGLEASVRERVQRQFQAGKLDCVVATIAFGMGIDKADVRTVVHFALPASVEAYYQEIGRAGRDGLPSRTVLLYSFVDRKIHDTFLERDYPPANELAKVARALTDEFLMPDFLASKLRLDRETVAKAVEKLAGHGAAQLDMAGNVRRAEGDGSADAWQSGYERQVDFRRSQIERMMHFAETPQCRMTALIRHFGDTDDGSRPCGVCDFCSPAAARAQTFAEPTDGQERELRVIVRALDGSSRSTGKLFTELAPKGVRAEFDALLDGLARAGLIALATDSFTNAEGTAITYKKASLTHEGRTLAPGAPLGVLLRTVAESSAPSSRSKRKRMRSAADDTAGAAPSSAAEKDLEAKLRAWRKAEAAKTGKPAFIVCSDAALVAVARAAPRTLSALLKVPGFGPMKVEQYGAAICALCRGEVIEVQDEPKQRGPVVTERSSTEDVRAPRSSTDTTAAAKNRADRDPLAALDSDQQELERSLRAWRKAESDKIAMPAFYILPTTALRSIVLNRPRTLAQLAGVEGIDPEKLAQFGPAILALCVA